MATQSFIFKRESAFTRHWLEAVEDVLAAKTAALARTPGDVRGKNPGYPLEWTEVLAHVIHPMELGWGKYLIQDDRLQMDIWARYQ